MVWVYNYNQIPGNNFQVFYREQNPSYVLPQTDPSLLSGRGDGQIGSPQAGLTNIQNWVRNGIALAGSLLPANAVSLAGINGLVARFERRRLRSAWHC